MLGQEYMMMSSLEREEWFFAEKVAEQHGTLPDFALYRLQEPDIMSRRQRARTARDAVESKSIDSKCSRAASKTRVKRTSEERRNDQKHELQLPKRVREFLPNQACNLPHSAPWSLQPSHEIGKIAKHF